MRKHGFALSFGFIGAGVTGLFSAGSDMFLFQCMLGFCFGMVIGYFVAGLIKAKSTILQQDFIKLGDLRGRSLDEIVKAVGPYKSFQSCTIPNRDNAPGYTYTWIEDFYSITLLFDAEKKCIGVSSETAA